LPRAEVAGHAHRVFRRLPVSVNVAGPLCVCVEMMMVTALSFTVASTDACSAPRGASGKLIAILLQRERADLDTADVVTASSQAPEMSGLATRGAPGDMEPTTTSGNQ
jgi:hypothetical protein